MNFDQLTGRTKDHLTWSDKLGFFIYPPAEIDLINLKKRAWKNGFDLQIASGFRNYERQKVIWNDKVLGKRPVLDRDSNPISPEKLKPYDLVLKILNWSALPGASRHHWGTDFDIYCLKSLPRDYKLQLTPQEFAPGGVLFSFGSWLRENLQDFNFFCPYLKDRGGVLPEPWHIGHGPSSTKFIASYTSEIYLQNLLESDLELRSILQEKALILYQNYFLKISPNPWGTQSIS
ncbi:MAG: D-alanyl-D-alanine carboxypeptidase family protein [Epsilonproteobacteria bacterium]|nr:MAG: D-alanyl-D-alanine carboxypeptidase family protein [Campylobacterota bacterium]RLA66306.1 MAG: D-alanyl-D-alanine carboxypeptidase family protein [Campylobacterota bacterium]